MPSVLSLLGSNPVEMSLLSTRRPLLSFVLALGAPVVNPIRMFDNTNPQEILRSLSKDSGSARENEKQIARQDRNDAAKENDSLARTVAILQYFFALGAAINILVVAIELDTKAYSVVLACKWRFLVYVWTFSATALHMLAWSALWTRAQFSDDMTEASPRPSKDTSLRFRAKLRQWKESEFSECMFHHERHFFWAPENIGYRIVFQLLAVGTVVQIFFGTIVLSSYQFLAPSDAVLLTVRYIVSAWIYRAILGYELSGLASQTTLEPRTAIIVSHNPGK